MSDVLSKKLFCTCIDRYELKSHFFTFIFRTEISYLLSSPPGYDSVMNSVDNIHMEGAVSHIFYLGPRYYVGGVDP